MKRLIRKILKEVEEEKLTSLQKTILDHISTFGIMDTIKMVGGFGSFDKILPDYFSKNSHKIDLINQIVTDNDPNTDGNIYFYELINTDISLGSVSYDNSDGHTFEEYMISVGEGSVQISVYEYDEDGHMYDEYVDNYYVSLGKLPDNELNKVFEVLVDYYL